MVSMVCEETAGPVPACFASADTKQRQLVPMKEAS